MGLGDLIAPDAVLPAARAPNKRVLLQQLSARLAALVGVDPDAALASVLERERLGSTGFGGGVAIPHGRLLDLPRPVGLLARLASPVDYDALDRQPVDLVVLLLAPAGAGADYLKALARVSRTMRDRALIAKLRGARDEAALHALLGPLATPDADAA